VVAGYDFVGDDFQLPTDPLQPNPDPVSAVLMTSAARFTRNIPKSRTQTQHKQLRTSRGASAATDTEHGMWYSSMQIGSWPNVCWVVAGCDILLGMTFNCQQTHPWQPNPDPVSALRTVLVVPCKQTHR
jgi:hypothetical protein